MPSFQSPNSHIHVLARSFLVRGPEVILCRVKGKEWYFLPGGHIEGGESALTALTREMHEELGLVGYTPPEFVGVCEYKFEEKPDVWQHEINIVFLVHVQPSFLIQTKEKHIEFVSVDKSSLSKLDVGPSQLKTGLLEWLKSGHQFYKQLPQ